MLNIGKSNENQVHEYIEHTIKTRRTINFFDTGRPIPTEQIVKAIEVARWAPNHKKTEPWHFYLLGGEIQNKVKDLIAGIKTAEQGEASLQAIRGRLDAIPGWLVLTCEVSTDLTRQFEDYAACACAAQNLMLYLWQAQIGVKWTTGKVIRDPRFFDLLGIDINKYKIVGLFWYGYPLQIPEQIRKPVVDILTVL